MPTQQSPEWTTSLDEKQFEQLLSTGSANRSVSISAEGTTTVLTRQATGDMQIIIDEDGAPHAFAGHAFVPTEVYPDPVTAYEYNHGSAQPETPSAPDNPYAVASVLSIITTPAERENSVPIEQLKTWLDELPSVDDVIQAAQELVQERGDITGEETTDCTNCKGAQAFEDMSCVCCIISPDDTPDDDCVRCDGSGTYDEDCGCCNGSGYTFLYPSIEVVNNDIGVARRLRIDTAKMIATGELPLTEEIVAPDNATWVRRTITADFDSYFSKLLEPIGLSYDDAKIIDSTGIGGMFKHTLGNVAVLSHTLYAREDRNKSDQQHPTLTESIAGVQASAVHAYGATGYMQFDRSLSLEELQSQYETETGRVLNNDLAIMHARYELVNIPSLSTILGQLAITADEANLVCAYSDWYAGMGESDQRFQLLDAAGQVADKYHASGRSPLREAASNALAHFNTALSA